MLVKAMETDKIIQEKHTEQEEKRRPLSQKLAMYRRERSSSTWK